MTHWRNNDNNYGAISRVLHWLMAILILLMFGIGWGRSYLPDELKRSAMNLHKLTGVFIMLLAALRLGWRLTNILPATSGTLSRLLGLGAHAMHGLLYLMLFVMPVSGWLLVSASGKAVHFFDLFELPALMSKNEAQVPLLQNIHVYAAITLVVLIGLHAGAALLHHFVFKDDTLRRMLPLLGRKARF